jgi:hypothetical protein
MESARWDETWHRLREWTNGQTPSERLAAQILISEGFKGLDPSHPLGGADGGKDAICSYDEDEWVMAVYFPRGKKKISEIKKKLQDDILVASKHQPYGIAFVTNQELTLSQRQEFKKIAEPLKLEIFHLERITSILDSPSMAGVRKQFLGIESIDNTPILEAQFYEPKSRSPLGTAITLKSIAYELPQRPIPNIEQPRTTFFGTTVSVSLMDQINPSYVREMEKYTRETALLQKSFIGIFNKSTKLAEGVILEVEGSLAEGIYVAEELPHKPDYNRINWMPPIRSQWWNSHITPDVEEYGDNFRITIKFGSIQPGHIAIMEAPVFLGSIECRKLLMNARVIANNLPAPVESSLQVEFDIISKPPVDLAFFAR